MNNELYIALGILVAIIAAVVVFWRLKKKASATAALKGCPVTHFPSGASDVCFPREWAYQIDRPDGGVCLVEHGTRPDAATLAMINNRIISGLEGMIAATLRDFPTWTNLTASGQYTVCFVRKMDTNLDGTPALLVGGYKSAGTIANVRADGSNRGLQYLIFPIPDDWNAPNYAAYLEASAYNEGEHAIEYNNDLSVFLMYTGGNDIHPHRPPVVVSFSGRDTSVRVSCYVSAGTDEQGVEIVGTKTIVR